MDPNMMQAERMVRHLGGIACVAVALFAELDPGWALLLFLLGVGSVVTGVLGRCPVNAVLGR